MNRAASTLSIRHGTDRFGLYAAGLRDILTAMDRSYAVVADSYGFCCTGCEDNCCRTRFYHHTYLELFYLHRGLASLDPGQRAAVRSRADDVCRRMGPAAPDRGASQQMCPLNLGDRCVLYEFRPMICRLHGIPHALQHPDGRESVGPGCDAFHRQCGAPADAVLDRTPHYRALAELERKFRRSAGLTEKLKLTVAEMIIRCDA